MSRCNNFLAVYGAVSVAGDDASVAVRVGAVRKYVQRILRVHLYISYLVLNPNATGNFFSFFRAMNKKNWHLIIVHINILLLE